MQLGRSRLPLNMVMPPAPPPQPPTLCLALGLECVGCCKRMAGLVERGGVKQRTGIWRAEHGDSAPPACHLEVEDARAWTRRVWDVGVAWFWKSFSVSFFVSF